MMRDPGTPNEVKLAGFANVLYDEWKKANPDRDLDPKTESARCLNLTYSRVSRDGPGQDDEESNHSTVWSSASKLLLLKVGTRVEELLRNRAAPSQAKAEDFGNLLQSEWKKEAHHYRAGVESVRSLVMMYTRLQREGLIKEEVNDDSEPRIITATWTPKHNRVLHDCMEKFSDLAVSAGLTAYKDCVIKSWRAKFSKSSISDEMLWTKVTDLSMSDDSQLHSLVKPEPKPEVIELDDIKHVKRRASSVSSAESHAPAISNSGHIAWNIAAIRSLFEAHRQAQEEIKYSAPKRSQLSTLVQANFLKSFPNCTLAPSILMAKLFSFKTSQSKGLLDLKMMPAEPVPVVKVSSQPVPDKIMPQVQFHTKVEPKEEPSSSSRSKSLIFRTWTQAMIDDMLSTRKTALSLKKKRSEEDPSDSLPMTEIWYEEFMKLQPGNFKNAKFYEILNALIPMFFILSTVEI